MSNAAARAGETDGISCIVGWRGRDSPAGTSSESFAKFRAVALNEVVSRDALLTFQLQFQNLQGRALAASHQQFPCCGCNFRRAQAVACDLSSQHLQVLAAKSGIGPGPRLKSAKAIQNFRTRAREINEPIFLLQDWSEGRSRIVLGLRPDRSAFQPEYCFYRQGRSNFGELWRECFSRVVRLDSQFFLQKDVSGIEAGVDAQRSDASRGFSVRDRPLDRRGTAVPRQKRRMKIDIPERWELKHPLRNDAAIANHDDGVRLYGIELLAELVIRLDSVRLRDRNSEGNRALLYGLGYKLEAASLGAVGLSDDQTNSESRCGELLECGNGKSRCAAKNEI